MDQSTLNGLYFARIRLHASFRENSDECLLDADVNLNSNATMNK